MKLRSSTKTKESRESQKIVEKIEVDKYTRELKEFFRELSKWDGCPTIRIDIMINIFSYVDKNVDNVKHEISLKTLHNSILNKAKLTMNDIIIGSSMADSVMLENLKQLAIISISIISKLG